MVLTASVDATLSKVNVAGFGVTVTVVAPGDLSSLW
jgi:hypothetical protein